MELEEFTKKSIIIALKSKNKVMIAVVLRKAARDYYFMNKRDTAVEMIKICLNILNPDSQLYKLTYRDFLQYFKGKNEIEKSEINQNVINSKEFPLKDLSNLIIEILN